MAINDTECLALLDTGATVSTISKSFYDSYLAHTTQLLPIGEQLEVECADGQALSLDMCQLILPLVVYLPLMFYETASF